MKNNQKERRRFNIISNKTFIFLIFIILQKKINTYNVSITITEKGNQQILDNSFPIPSEITINNISQIPNDDNIYDLTENNNNILITWNTKLTSCSKMFYNLKNITAINFIDFDTSLVISMTSMFHGCSNINRLNLAGFDTSKVESMDYMFYYCDKLTLLNINNFNTELVVTMKSMFYGCSNLLSLNLNHFITSKVTDMSFLFYNCSKLVSLSVDNFNTESVILMNNMFENCRSIISLNLNGFKTSEVVTMNHMFSSCRELISLDISNFDTSSTYDMEYMFYDCYKLPLLVLNHFNTSNVMNMAGMFSQCSNLANLNISNFNTSLVVNMEHMFSDCYRLTSLDLNNFNVSLVKNMTRMFGGCQNLIYLNISSFKTSSLINMEEMFDECHELTSLNLEQFDTSKIRNMKKLFYNCYSLTSLNLVNFDTSLVTDMESLFSLCSKLEYLNIDNFNTTSVISMKSMFSSCESLTSLNLNSFNTNLVQNMFSMFYNCYALTSLDVSGFNTSLVKDMQYMFTYCAGLVSLNLINFDVSSVTNIDSMFSECPNLKSLNILNFEISSNTSSENILEESNPNVTICYNPDKVSSLSLYLSNFKNNCTELCCNGNYSYCLNYFYCTEASETFTGEVTSASNKYETTTNEVASVSNDYEAPIGEVSVLSNNYEIPASEVDLLSNNSNSFENTNDKTYYIDEKIKNESDNDEFNIIEPVKNQSNDVIMKYIGEYLNNINPEIIINRINSGKDIIYKNNGLEIHISNTENQQKNKNNNETAVLLGDCEKELKTSYNISDNESLIIYKADILKENWKIPITEYAVYYPLNGTILNKLNLSKCENIKIEILTPLLINDKDIDKYNSSSDYYRDICYKSSSKYKTDITMDDRKNEYLDNNMSPCEEKCDFIKYDNINKKSICSCDVKTEMREYSEINIDKSELIKKFINIKNLINLNVMKCHKIFLSKSGIVNNYALYLVSSFLLIHFSFMAFYYFKEKQLLYNKIKKVINIEDEEKKNNANYLEENSNQISNRFIKHHSMNIRNKNKRIKRKKKRNITNDFNKNNPPKKPEIKETEKERNSISHLQSRNLIIINNNYNNYNHHYLKNSKDTINDELPKENNDKIIDYSIKNDMTINEINSLPYKDALIIDNRTYLQYSISLIKVKHILYFSFFINNDYNSKLIKIDLFLFLFIVSFGINALFFNDSTMHKIYLDKGLFNLAYQIPKIIYSTIISLFISILIKQLALIEKNIISLKLKIKDKSMTDKEKEIEKLRVKKIVTVKILLFYVFSVMLYLFFWYYLGCFCAVYENTKIHLIKDTLLSFLLSLIYPLFINLIPGIFRINALKNNNSAILYKISQLLQLI